jgi:hypothetical protein
VQAGQAGQAAELAAPTVDLDEPGTIEFTAERALVMAEPGALPGAALGTGPGTGLGTFLGAEEQDSEAGS